MFKTSRNISRFKIDYFHPTGLKAKRVPMRQGCDDISKHLLVKDGDDG